MWLIVLAISIAILALIVWPILSGIRSISNLSNQPDAPTLGPHHWEVGRGVSY
jgi:hypothetical protein